MAGYNVGENGQVKTSTLIKRVKTQGLKFWNPPFPKKVSEWTNSVDLRTVLTAASNKRWLNEMAVFLFNGTVEFCFTEENK